MTKTERVDLEAQLDAVWSLVQELEDISDRLTTAADAAVAALALRTSDQKDCDRDARS